MPLAVTAKSGAPPDVRQGPKLTSMSAALGLVPNPPDIHIDVGRVLKLVRPVGGKTGATRIAVLQACDGKI
jgi:hypothetical protein